jgi:hypothetical protein
MTALPTLTDQDRTIDPGSGSRFPWVALYRRSDTESLEASFRRDLDDPQERILLRLIGQDGNGRRRVLAVTNRRLVVVSLAGDDGELVQRAVDRFALAITVFFDFFYKRTKAFREELERAMTVSDAALLSREILWSTSFYELARSAKAVLLRARSFPFAPGVSYPVRSLWNAGSMVGLRFDSDDDFRVLSGVLDQLSGFLAERGITCQKKSMWHQINLPDPAVA